MATISPSQGSANSYSAKNLCLIVGLTCLAGFLIDMIIMGLPANPGALEWRIGFLQQLGDRSIVLLFGSALTLFGMLDERRLLRQIALFCLVAGVLFHLAGILVIRDSLTLQKQTVSNITSRANELQTQIQQTQSAPALPENVTSEQLRQASDLVASQASDLQRNAQTSIIRLGLFSLGNLFVVGLGLICLGRYGLRLRRSR
ncbi:MAG: hypothetical protein HC881_15200 [Leptolyngbyaceae cyanobacterium SL_7_1]|nr:hypothetical protein [Leptolyngbyaceae cyanobacterium SL_7_1]